MKKNLILTAFFVSLLTLSACGNASENTNSDNVVADVTSSVSPEKSDETKSNADNADDTADTTDSGKLQSNAENDDEKSKILVAYFTMPEDGTDADAGASRVVTADGDVQGNVEYFANIIAEETDADMFRIETVEQYPGDHEPLVDQAAEERDSGARPELASHIENLDDYDTVFIGYPIWWYDMPMAMNTFFEEYDFSGKTIVPFSSHGGSGFSSTIEQITEYEPNAKLLEGFTVSRDDVYNSDDDLKAWISDLDI